MLYLQDEEHTMCWSCLYTKNERLQKIVDRLPKTADGIPIVLCETELWWLPPSYISTTPFFLGKCFCITYGYAMTQAYVMCEQGCQQLLSECYSTPEAAEKAKN
jgi:hypothetical protein